MIALSANDMNKTYISQDGNHYSTTEISNNTFDKSRMQSSTTYNDYSKDELDIGKNEFTTVTNSPNSSNVTSNIISLDTRYQYNNTSWSNSNVSTESHDIGVTYGTSTEKSASKGFSNCLIESIKDSVRRHWNYTYNTYNRIFKKLKAKNNKRTIRKRNNINGYVADRKNISASKTSSFKRNEFWRYVTFPTKDPLTISTKAQPYRIPGLNEIETNPRKSRKDASLNTNIYEIYRRFYKITEK